MSQDFEEHGVFEAQSALELVHREEEDELYKEMYEERKRKLSDLQRELEFERQRTVKELIAFFEKKNISKEERQIGLKKVGTLFIAILDILFKLVDPCLLLMLVFAD